MRKIVTLATLVVREALCTHFFVVAISLLIVGFGVAMFVGQVAIIETRAYQSSLLAAFLRLSGVYIISLFVISSMVHEFNDRLIYLWLSLPMQRSTYLFGKFSGFALIAFITTVFFSSALLIYVPYQQVGIWALSFFCELLIIIAISLLCVLTFHQTVKAFSAVLGFYILARSISVIQLMVSGSLFDSASWVDQLINIIINLLAMLLPNLEFFTRSEWLVYHTGQLEILSGIFIQTIIYTLLLITMSLFDLHRKNL